MVAWAAAIPAIISAGAQLYSATRGSRERDVATENPAIPLLMQASANSQRYSQALASGPSDPYFRNLAALFREALINQGLEGIKAYEGDRQRRIGRGARVVRSEREDESRNRAIARMFFDARQLSNKQAASTLAQAAQGSAQAAGAAQGGIQPFLQYGTINRDLELARIKGISDFGQQIFGMLSSQNQSTPYVPQGGNYSYNTVDPGSMRELAALYGG